MITLEEFKNMLIEEIPVSKKVVIIEQLEKIYSDNKLQKIIDDTYSFIKEILDSEEIKKGYLVFQDLDEFKKHYDCIYWYTSDCVIRDRLYVVPEDRIISTRIMKKVFGSSLNIYDSQRERWHEGEIEEEDWCETVYTTKFDGFPVERLDEIKQDLFGKTKLLVKGTNLNKQI